MKYERYKKLYARFLRGSPDQLLDLAGDISDCRVLDLCTGGGRLAEAAMKRGAYPVVVDEDLEMMADIDSRIRKMLFSVDTALATIVNNSFDAIFCQQAINYWFSPENIEAIHGILVPGGRFIFNTFNTCPETFPRANIYVIEEKGYLELSWLVEKTVYHVQIVEDESPDIQSFKWISPEEFRSTLSPFFEVAEIRKGRTNIYKCINK